MSEAQMHRLMSECRLCDWRGEGWQALNGHWTAVHALQHRVHHEGVVKLHAAKDYPDRSENTLGIYDGEGRLLGLVIEISPRSADDPMGWEHLP